MSFGQNENYLIRGVNDEGINSNTDIDDIVEKKIQNINKTIYNLDFHLWNILAKKSTLQGGSEKTVVMSENKYNKMKSFIKSAKNAIIYYRDIAQNYHNSYNIIFLNYMYLLEILKNHKNYLSEKQSQYSKLSKDYANGRDKISMLETMINNIDKLVKKTTNLDVEIKNKIDEKNIDIKTSATFNNENPVKLFEKKFSLSPDSVKNGGTNFNIKMYGGAEMDFDEFQKKITEDLEILDKESKEMEDDLKKKNKKKH